MSPSRRPWWPHPWLSLLLLAVWLVLQHSVAPAHVLSGLVMAWGLPWLLVGFLGGASRPRNLGLILRFTATVLWDIVVSNLVVARIVLNPWSRPQPAWVPVPVTLTDPLARTLLASIITTTPGTVSCVLLDDGDVLVHALDCQDPAALARDIQQRYEAPLRAIFEGASA
jgi:multicomponent K+:H+ antiporter subunit E